MSSKKLRKKIILIFLIVLFSSQGFSQDLAPDRRPAPELSVSEWVTGPPLTLQELDGKVVVIAFFQMAQEGSLDFSVPLMDHWYKMYWDDPRIQLIGIHSVLEKHMQQTPHRLRQFVRDKEIVYPVAVDDFLPGEMQPMTYYAYAAEGTPEIIVIDKKGDIRFRRFGPFDFKRTEILISNLVEEEF